MSLYRTLHVLRTFQYRRRKVCIAIMLRGRSHCGLDYGPDTERCTVCERRLKPPTVVKNVTIDREDVGVEFAHSASIDDVKEFARDYIDDITDKEKTGPETARRIRRKRSKRGR